MARLAQAIRRVSNWTGCPLTELRTRAHVQRKARQQPVEGRGLSGAGLKKPHLARLLIAAMMPDVKHHEVEAATRKIESLKLDSAWEEYELLTKQLTPGELKDLAYVKNLRQALVYFLGDVAQPDGIALSDFSLTRSGKQWVASFRFQEKTGNLIRIQFGKLRPQAKRSRPASISQTVTVPSKIFPLLAGLLEAE